MNVPDNHTEEKAIIKPLLQAMCSIQDALESDLSEHDIELNNALYDEITVGFLETSPDGSDYQSKLKEDKYKITFSEAREALLRRLCNMTGNLLQVD